MANRSRASAPHKEGAPAGTSRTPAGASPTPAVAPHTAYLLAAFAMIIYSSPPVVTRAVILEVPPLALSLSRWVIAFAILLPLAWRRLPKAWPELRCHVPSLAFLAAFMVAGSTLSVVAVYFTTATNAVLVNASQPAITAALAWAVAGTVLLPRQRLGILCAFVGIVIMVVRADIGVLLSFELNVGDLIMLGAVTGWSTYAVLLPKRDYTPDGVTLMLLIAVVGIVGLTPPALIESAVVGRFEFTRDVVAAMVYLAVFPTLLATFAWNLAIRAVGANRTAIFVNLIPVSGAALAMTFLGERLYAYHLIGAGFVFAGIYLAVRRQRV
jgi:drug/metabolite transporter (DMT)-like permease